jgi:uncharacterized protein (TIGR02271 family)
VSGSDGTGGGRRSRPQHELDQPEIVAHEEELVVDKRWEGVGYARVSRGVEQQTVRGDYPRQVEELAYERVAANDDDSGQVETLPDGSISIPLFEEELVVTKRTVLRERVVIRKNTVTETGRIEEKLRREYISVDTSDVPDGSVEIVDDIPGST